MKPGMTQFKKFCLCVICGVLVGSVLPAFAQYSLAQYVIAGGGGQATGGGWTLNATIGQPVAGTASGGGMVLQAGFWSAQLQGPPVLTITRSGSNVVLIWPSNATGFNLQQTAGLAPSSWTLVNAVPIDDGVTKSVTVPITNAASFYRLAQ